MKFIWLIMLLVFVLASKAQENTKLKEARKLLNVNPGRAILIAEEVYTYSIKKLDYYNSALSCSIISSALQKDGDVKLRFKYDSLFLSCSRLSGDTSLLLKALNSFASDLMDMNKTSEAKRILDESESYFGALYQPDYCRWLQLKAGYAFKLFRMNEAFINYKKALAVAESIPDMNESVICKMKIGESVLYKGKSDSMHLVYQALEYFEKVDDHNHAADAASIIGFAFQTSFNIDNALIYYQKALSYAAKVMNKNKEVNIKLKMGDIFLSQKKFDEALKLFKSCENFYSGKGYNSGLALSKIYLGRLYTQTGEYELAVKCFDDADELNKIINSDNIKIATKAYRMMLSVKMKKFKEADSLASSAVKLASEVVDKDARETALKKFREGTSDSEHTALSADLIFERSMNADNKRDHRPIMSDSEFRKLENLNVYTGKDITKDSSVLSVSNQQIHELETKYRTRQITDSLQNQQQENIIAQQNLKQRNYFLAGAAIIVLLLIVFGWLQFQNRKKAEKDKEHIQLLQNEIHHRVKNNLAVINRLVEVSGKNAADNVPLSALKNRIKSIELLHKHLYSEEAKPGHISLQPYLEDLCVTIAATFESAKRVNILIDAKQEVESDIAEKVGLIINELVTNSYKYAFAGKPEGTISISADKDIHDLKLVIQDDGIGFIRDLNKESYGMKLIRGLSHQLDAKFSFENDKGTRFHLIIPV